MAFTSGTESLKTFGKNRIALFGSYVGNGVSAPTSVKGPRGATVVRTGVGIYTLTIPGFGTREVISAMVQVRGTAQRQCRFDAVSETAGTFQIRTFATDGTTATDMASTDVVSYEIVIRNTSVANA